MKNTHFFKKTVCIISIAAASMVANTAFAKGKVMNGQVLSAEELAKHMEKRQERLFKKVNATEAQQTQIKAIMQANQPDMSQMQALKTQLKAAVDQYGRDSDQVKAVREQINAQRTRMIEQRQAVDQKIRAVLNADQQKTFDEMTQKKHDRQSKRLDKMKGKSVKATKSTEPKNKMSSITDN